MLDRTYKEIISKVPAPQYTQTHADFALQELNFQIEHRVKAHDLHPAIQRLLASIPQENIKENTQGLPDISKERLDKNSIEKLHVQTVVDDSLLDTTGIHPNEADVPLQVSESERTLKLINILSHYIQTKKDELEKDIESSKQYKTKLIEVKFESSVEEKINAARHLIDLLEQKPDTKPLEDKEFSALTTSRLGNKTAEYIDLIEHFYKPEFVAHRGAQG
ncbi:hypothetical protein [Legionella sp. WA2024007413]